MMIHLSHHSSHFHNDNMVDHTTIDDDHQAEDTFMQGAQELFKPHSHQFRTTLNDTSFNHPSFSHDRHTSFSD